MKNASINATINAAVEAAKKETVVLRVSEKDAWRGFRTQPKSLRYYRVPLSLLWGEWYEAGVTVSWLQGEKSVNGLIKNNVDFNRDRAMAPDPVDRISYCTIDGVQYETKVHRAAKGAVKITIRICASKVQIRFVEKDGLWREKAAPNTLFVSGAEKARGKEILGVRTHNEGRFRVIEGKFDDPENHWYGYSWVTIAVPRDTEFPFCITQTPDWEYQIGARKIEQWVAELPPLFKEKIALETCRYGLFEGCETVRAYQCGPYYASDPEALDPGVYRDINGEFHLIKDGTITSLTSEQAYSEVCGDRDMSWAWTGHYW